MNNISFFIGSLSGGGSERVCVNLANSLSHDNCHKISIVTLSGKNDVFAKDVAENIKLESLNVQNARFALWSVIKYLREKKTNVAVAFSYELTVLLILVRKIFRLKFLIVARNVNNFSQNVNDAETWWRRNIAIPIIKRLYAQADYYINQCEGMQSDLLSLYPELSTRSCVIYNPVKQSFFEPHQFNKVDYQFPFLLCVGRLENQKNFADAITAFSLVSQLQPSLKLVIIGEGSLKSQLQEHSRNLGIDNRVIFEGFKTNIEDYYISARATILTSKYEGFPNVLLESIALGTPVISYNCPSGPSEIIIDGVNGYLVENENIDEMANSIMKVMDGSFDVKSIRSTADKYQNEAIIREYLSCINKVRDKMAA